jgi:hypothetical protein
MMTKAALALVILILSGFCAARCGATVHYSDGSMASVEALQNAAHDGDTIMLPEGTFSWISPLEIRKGITLQGATTITGAGTANPTINDATKIKDDGTGGGLIRVNLRSNQAFRLTGVSFVPGSNTSTKVDGAVILRSYDSAPCTSMRIDHCHFAQIYYKAIWVNGWVYGVADHNVIENRPKMFSFYVTHSQYGGKSQINGNGAWADYPWFGTDKFFFIEDNTLIGSGKGVVSGTIDSDHGGRWVARHNYWKNALPSGHGTEGGALRGQRASEFYDNTVEWTITWAGAGQRSGTSLWHDNTFIGVESKKGGHTGLANYRQTPARSRPVWGIADGTSVWDQNDTEGNGTYVEGHSPHLFDSGTDTSSVNSQGVIHDSTKNWTSNQWVDYSIKNMNRASASYGLGSYIISNTSDTITYYYYSASDTPAHLIFNAGDTYQIHRVLTMMDQNGRGKGDQVTGNPPINARSRKPSWPHQALEPCYSWNNIHSPTGHVYGFFTPPTQPTTKLGIDYFNLGGGFPADTTPSEVSSRYTAALNGVDYTGTYVYPHPLVSGAPTPSPDPAVKPSFSRLQKGNKGHKPKKQTNLKRPNKALREVKRLNASPEPQKDE